jgi:hypothetical protein
MLFILPVTSRPSNKINSLRCSRGGVHHDDESAFGFNEGEIAGEGRSKQSPFVSQLDNHAHGWHQIPSLGRLPCDVFNPSRARPSAILS